MNLKFELSLMNLVRKEENYIVVLWASFKIISGLCVFSNDLECLPFEELFCCALQIKWEFAFSFLYPTIAYLVG